MVEVYRFNVREVYDRYTYYACESDINTLRWLRYKTRMWEQCVANTPGMRVKVVEKSSVIIIDSECSAHMFSDWRVFRNFRTKTGIQVKCASDQLIEASDVGDLDFLIGILLVPQPSFLTGN